MESDNVAKMETAVGEANLDWFVPSAHINFELSVIIMTHLFVKAVK